MNPVYKLKKKNKDRKFCYDDFQIFDKCSSCKSLARIMVRNGSYFSNDKNNKSSVDDFIKTNILNFTRKYDFKPGFIKYNKFGDVEITKKKNREYTEAALNLHMHDINNNEDFKISPSYDPIDDFNDKDFPQTEDKFMDKIFNCQRQVCERRNTIRGCGFAEENCGLKVFSKPYYPRIRTLKIEKLRAIPKNPKN